MTERGHVEEAAENFSSCFWQGYELMDGMFRDDDEMGLIEEAKGASIRMIHDAGVIIGHHGRRVSALSICIYQYDTRRLLGMVGEV